MVTVDIATLIGLLANPAYLAGHGSIDPELARELARTSAWQILLTEAVTLAETLGLAVQNPDTGEWEQRPNTEKDDPATEPETGAETGTAAPDAGAADSGADSAAQDRSGADAGAGADSAADDKSGADAGAQTAPATGTASTAPTGATASTGVTASTAGAAVSTAARAPQDTPPPPPERESERESERGRAVAGVRPDESASTPGPVPHVAAPGPESGSAQNHAATKASTSETGSTPEPTTGSVTGSMSETGREPAASPVTAAAAQRAEDTASSKPDPARETAESEFSATTSETETGTSAGTESASETGPAAAAAAAADSGDQHQRRLQSLTSAAALFCTHTPTGRGTRHSSALDLPALDLSALTITSRESPKPAGVQGIHLGPASLAAALEAAIAADPTLGKSFSRDPLTDRALIYRPDALTAAAVRFRDRHCRFPGCQRPAERCQLDHITPFDHSNPLGGGWSTINNLQCLCAFHHAVKTAGYWKATMLPGGAILWRSTSKTTRITLPANGTTVSILGNDLRPHIPTKPKRSGIIAYPHPPDNPKTETETEPDTHDSEAPPF